MCIDWQLTFNGLTGGSTLAMAIFAGIALSSWQKEFKAKKKTEVYENLLTTLYEIDKFLENLLDIYNQENLCETKLEKFSYELKLSAQKILIIGNKSLHVLLENLSSDMEPIKYYSEQNEDGSYHPWYEKFTDNYLKNKNNFRDNLNKSIIEIKKCCVDKLASFYN